jgi:hypothetical protein
MNPRETKMPAQGPPPAEAAKRAQEAELAELRRLVGELGAQRDDLERQLRAAAAGSDAESEQARQREQMLAGQEQQLAEQGERIRALERELATRAARIDALQSAAGSTAEAHLLADLAELRRRVGAQAEALQRREARRQVYDAQLREREAWIDERDAEIEQLADALQSLQPTGRGRGGPADSGRGGGMPGRYAPEAHSATPAAIAEARIAALSRELDALHARTAARPAVPGESGFEANRAAPGDSLRAEVAALRLANAQLRVDLEDREARLAQAPVAPDTGTFASTGDFGPAGGSDSYMLTDGQLRMLVRTEGDTGIVHVLGRRTTIGRTPDNDLCVDSESVSRHHAVALQTATGTVVEDLNSTNGVLVNGQRFSRRQLAEGDVLTIGKASFRYLVKPADEAANS